MKHFKWIILGLLFLASVINFIDRQSLSILARTIQNDLGITDLGYSTVVQMFLFAYMLSFLVVGWVTDRLGIRLSMTLFIAWWSLANLATGFANSMRSLAAARFFLGMGESGLYVVAPKVVGEIFPAEQRGLAVGVYTAGATIGATLAPPIIAGLALTFDWRGAFYTTGALGLIWIVPWLFFYQKRRGINSAGVSQDVPETETPESTTNSIPASDSETSLRPEDDSADSDSDDWSWKQILFCREALLLLAARTITDPVWHFVLFWFPKCLMDAHDMSLEEVGKIAWVPYLAADIGCLAGGFLSGIFIKRGLRPPDARKWTMFVAAMLIPTSALVPLVSSHSLILLLVSVVAFAHMTWIVTLTTLAVDIFPAKSLGRIFGLIAMGSGFGGMMFTYLVGHLVTSFSYTPVFILMGCLHPLALFLIWRAVSSAHKRQEAEAKQESIS